MLKGAPSQALSTFELVAVVAALIGLNALSIDIMLPALPDIGGEFALANDNDRQWIVTAYVVTFGAGQLFYGPLSDAFGRRSVLIWALGLYLIGTLLCVFAPTFSLMIAARGLQGFGAAATRVIATAVVRDLYSGRRMAQIMSLAMSIFTIAPIIAPGLGQLILFIAPWRWIFGALLIYGAALVTWTLLRLPETLDRANRTPLHVTAIAGNFAAALSNRQILGYILAGSCMASALFGYIAVSEQVYVEVFDLGAAFPIAFAAVALVMSLGAGLNARFVMRFGMRRIAHMMAIWFVLIAAAHAALTLAGVHSFWLFVTFLSLTFCVFSLIFGNCSALSMEPAGRMAGTVAALYGALTSLLGALLGGAIAARYDGTATPFLIGLAASGAAAFLVMLWTERGKLFANEAEQP